jgi:hypothetical protein
MDKHMTYDKEKLLNVNEPADKDTKKKEDKFIWSYVIRPVRKDFNDK